MKTPIRDEFEKLASISGSQLQQPCYGFLTYTMVNYEIRLMFKRAFIYLEFGIR
jgi:hypothetical protein